MRRGTSRSKMCASVCMVALYSGTLSGVNELSASSGDGRLNDGHLPRSAPLLGYALLACGLLLALYTSKKFGRPPDAVLHSHVSLRFTLATTRDAVERKTAAFPDWVTRRVRF